jgi:uncharacterized membrane protein
MSSVGTGSTFPTIPLIFVPIVVIVLILFFAIGYSDKGTCLAALFRRRKRESAEEAQSATQEKDATNRGIRQRSASGALQETQV